MKDYITLSGLVWYRGKRRAYWISALPFLTRASATWSSDEFLAFPEDSYLFVTFRVTDKSRALLHATVYRSPFDTSASGKRATEKCFIEENGAMLREQLAAYDEAVTKLPKWEAFPREFPDSEYRKKLAAGSASAPEAEAEAEAPEAEAVALPSVPEAPATAPEKTRKADILDKPASGFLGNVYLRKEESAVFATALKLLDRRPVNLVMIGASGYGKTSIPEAVAAARGMRYVRVNCAEMRDTTDWFGYMEAVDGNTVFVPSTLTKALIAGNAIIVLDEFNRVESWLHNALFPLLDHAKRTEIHGMPIEIGSRVLIVATLNQGYRFSGTFMLDSALTNRFDASINVRALPVKVEQKILVARAGIAPESAASIVSALSELRKLNESGALDADCSTRTALKIADLFSAGIMSLKDTFSAVLLNTLPEEQLKSAVDVLNVKLDESAPAASAFDEEEEDSD